MPRACKKRRIFGEKKDCPVIADMSKWKPISIDYLYEGLPLEEDIYDYKGNLLLLAKGTVLTETYINRLRQIKELGRNILVSVKLHGELIEKGIPEHFGQRHLEEKTGYAQLKNATLNLFEDIKSRHKVSYNQASDISKLLYGKLEDTDPALIFQCINGYREVDEYLFRHSVNVALLNGYMGKWLKLPAEEISVLVIAGLVHDIGKTLVPPNILNAPRKLTEAEFEIVKMHSVYSYELLSKEKRFRKIICEIARHHHEKMNGKGYPDHLIAEKIPYYARITTVSDIYDAMVSQRCYKNANSPFRILVSLTTQQFSDLDIRLVKLFTEMMPVELVGKWVLLSNGSVATVKHVNQKDLEYPLVEVSGEIIKTSEELYCVSMITDESDIDFSKHFKNLHFI